MNRETMSDAVLLSTKLKMPAPRKNYIVRSELFEELSRCDDLTVIFIKGGAGTGKTTLLSSFIRETGLSQIAWLSLDETNDNVFSFWHYFAAAAAKFFGEEREDILSLLRSNFEASHMETLLTLMINRLCSDEDYYIVLDDIHTIKDKVVIDTLEFFLKSAPENLHIFILSREEPAVYLGELAVSGRLLFINGENLRFSKDEGLRFLKETLKLSESDENLVQINEFAEGWIGGLQLLAASGGKYKDFLHVVGNSIAAEYLTREIFQALTDEERHFLTVTGILSYFDAEICSHLIEADFNSMITSLTAKNLFVICVDEENGIYRYHNILSEYLKQQFACLKKQEQLKLRHDISSALEARGDTFEALWHLFMAEDYEGAANLLKKMEETIETWYYINKLPIEIMVSDLNLSMQCLMYNIGTMNFTRGRELCLAMEKQFSGMALDFVHTAMQFVYPYINEKLDGRLDYELAHFDRIEELNLSPITKALIFLGNSMTLLDLKRYETCKQFANRALEVGCGANLCVDFYSLSSKAQLAEETGNFNEGLVIYEQMRRLLKSAAIIEVIGLNLYVGITGIYLKRMESESAKEALEKTKNLVDRTRPSQIIPEAVISYSYGYNLAEYEILFGDKTKGLEIVGELANSGYINSVLPLDRLLTDLLAQNVIVPNITSRFIEEYRSSSVDKKSLPSQLLYARLLWESGNTDTALEAVDSVLTFSRENKNKLRLVESGLLKIHMLVSQGGEHRRIAENLLREAIYYACENRILQPFFVERKCVVPLIKEYLKTGSDLSLEQRKFMFDMMNLCVDERQAGVKDILSTRELEVIAELSKGLTNNEIAQRLCISLATVKTHIINIYGKLGVSSRLSAVEGAKSRGLL